MCDEHVYVLMNVLECEVTTPMSRVEQASTKTSESIYGSSFFLWRGVDQHCLTSSNKYQLYLPINP